MVRRPIFVALIGLIVGALLVSAAVPAVAGAGPADHAIAGTGPTDQSGHALDRSVGADEGVGTGHTTDTTGPVESVECSYPLTTTDATGTDVTLEEPAEDVVVLDAASAQIVWEIGAEDRVIGMPVEEYTAYLSGSEERTDVLTGEGQVEVETVVDLEPDLVVAPNFTPEDTVDQLREAGVTVYQFELEDSLSAIYTNTELIGAFVDECDAAAQTVADTRETVADTRESVSDRDEPRVLYYFFGFTAGEGTFIHELIVVAGGENVAAEAGIEGYEQISAEVVAERDPEWIVSPDDPGAFDPEEEPFPGTTAVERGQYLTVDANLVSQAGPRVVEPMRTMAAAFHPEAFPDEAVTPEGTPAHDDALDMPGFGASVAVLAVLGLALIATRRRHQNR